MRAYTFLTKISQRKLAPPQKYVLINKFTKLPKIRVCLNILKISNVARARPIRICFNILKISNVARARPLGKLTSNPTWPPSSCARRPGTRTGSRTRVAVRLGRVVLRGPLPGLQLAPLLHPTSSSNPTWPPSSCARRPPPSCRSSRHPRTRPRSRLALLLAVLPVTSYTPPSVYVYLCSCPPSCRP